MCYDYQVFSSPLGVVYFPWYKNEELARGRTQNTRWRPRKNSDQFDCHLVPDPALVVNYNTYSICELLDYKYNQCWRTRSRSMSLSSKMKTQSMAVVARVSILVQTPETSSQTNDSWQWVFPSKAEGIHTLMSGSMVLVQPRAVLVSLTCVTTKGHSDACGLC